MNNTTDGIWDHSRAGSTATVAPWRHSYTVFCAGNQAYEVDCPVGTTFDELHAALKRDLRLAETPTGISPRVLHALPFLLPPTERSVGLPVVTQVYDPPIRLAHGPFKVLRRFWW